MKISTLFVALLLGLTAMTACQNDAPQSATPPATTETTQPAAAPDQTVPMQQVAPSTGSMEGQVTPREQSAPSSATPPSGAVAGINPAHGQPGHRCDIAVGASLDSKPMAKPQ
ncbi:MAG: hypothetical protein LH618_08410 [Saprospiraceae bacterium]|nr:hypothetical protein [Saprospiraceae bacterium]